MINYFSTGQIAEKTGIHKETLRYYEREGLIEVPQRGSNGYRQYTEDTLKKITFIKTAQQLGFSLGEIRELSMLSVKKGESCTQVHEKVNEKLDLINKKIRDLNEMKRVLKEFSNRCVSKDKMEDCHFIHSLLGIEGDCDEKE